MYLSSASCYLYFQPSHFKARTRGVEQVWRRQDVLKSAPDWQKTPTGCRMGWFGTSQVPTDNFNFALALSLPFSIFSLFFSRLCWAAFEDCQSRYEKRTPLSCSLFSKRNLWPLCSGSPIFLDSKQILAGGLARGHQSKSKQNSKDIKHYQRENQCPSWAVWCYWLFSARLSTDLIFF